MSLFVVATPIGNLDDITFRAIKTLKEADLIACEDTRRTLVLLNHFGIRKTLVSFHQRSKLKKVEYLVDELVSGKNIALVTDAGTPGVSDPGGVLVAEALKAGVTVVPVPGASALMTLASVSGWPMDRFVFMGFLPHKKGRQTAFEKIMASELPVIFYESPHRLEKALEALKDSGGKMIIGRELTKKFEEIFRGSCDEAYKYFRDKKVLGEFVLIFSKDN